MEGKEFYFETDDRLGRRKYAEFLKTLLEHCDEYRREDSDGAYVIAIDSSWGTGKTRFAKMLRNFLENRTNETPTESAIDPNKGFLTVYYNSWDTDFSNDALEPLIYSLINSPEFESELFEKQADEEIVEFTKTAKNVLKVIGLSAAHHFLGETATKALEVCLGEDVKNQDELCEYEKRSKAICEFKKTLSCVVEKTIKKKLVIIIDELDRSRPTFAIQTLEIVKHLFDVDGLIFIFALDIKQLSCSVETIYGKEMDAPGYLCRFFDYVGRMPNPNQKDFIKICFDQHRAFDSLYENWAQSIPDYFVAISESFLMGLRDVTTIIKTYFMALDSFLLEYKYPQYHFLYLFLLALKYKHGSLYSDFLLHKKNGDDKESTLSKVKKYLPTLEGTQLKVLNNQLSQLSINQQLQHCQFELLQNYISANDRQPLYSSIRIETVKTTETKKFEKIYEIITRARNSSSSDWVPYMTIRIDNKLGLSDTLEFVDILKWNEIKDLTLGGYYFQQLEMFNFALPADETTPKA